jgi:UTP:GlnB (protein PII) uridylyltransferase
VLRLVGFSFQSLGAGSLSFRGPDVEAVAEESQTTIELVGRDRPGLLSEVFAVLTDLKCNIAASEVWTHGARVAALVHVTDAGTLGPVEDAARLDTAKRLLRHVLRGGGSGRAAVPPRRVAHAQRRLHQMMHADRSRGGVPVAVAVEDCAERGYTVVNVRCRDRPELLFDTVCTLADMQYVVFHGTVIAEEGAEAYQVRVVRAGSIRQHTVAACFVLAVLTLCLASAGVLHPAPGRQRRRVRRGAGPALPSPRSRHPAPVHGRT